MRKFAHDFISFFLTFLPVFLGWCIFLSVIISVGCTYGLDGRPRIDWSQLFAQQEWSQNYALMESVTCSSAEMIDGDLKTVGSSGHQILIELPERKAIHRIVIRQTNIEDLILYAGASKSQGDWRKVVKIKDNRQTTFEIRQAFVTDRIRMRIGGTMDDVRIAPEYVANASGLHKVNVRRGKPFAHEIELYGFKDKVASEEKTQPDGETLF